MRKRDAALSRSTRPLTAQIAFQVLEIGKAKPTREAGDARLADPGGGGDDGAGLERHLFHVVEQVLSAIACSARAKLSQPARNRASRLTFGSRCLGLPSPHVGVTFPSP